MTKPTGTRIRQSIDLVVTLAMGVAAVLIILRTIGPPGAPSARAAGAAIEDVSDAQLTARITGAPVLGDRSARVAMIEFSDFECPFCKRYVDETFSRIKDEFIATGRIQYAARHLPLEQTHPNALRAAQAAACAADQGKFWEMRDYLFARQAELAQDVWLRDAAVLGLDEKVFHDCLSGASADRIRADQAAATGLGATATPTFLVGVVEPDGTIRILRRIAGAHPFEAFADAIEQVALEGGGV